MKPLTKKLITLTTLLMAVWGHQAAADGIGGSGIVRYFGSVVIDGVHYDTEGAVIRINGEPADESALKVGYHVSYRADGDTNEAWSVDYYDTVAGALESVHIDDAALQQASMIIMGQRVEIDADTWLHGVSLDALEPGMFLAVSADRLPDGSLVASSVDAVRRSQHVLSGPISAIDGTSLQLGGITVDVSAIGPEPDGVALVPGEWVHALGEYDVDAEGRGVLYAARLVRELDRDVKPMPAKLEGALRREGGTWWIRDHALSVPGALDARLRPGLRATVSGTLAASGQLIAREVRTEKRRFQRLDGMIEAMDSSGTVITVSGTPVRLDGRTSFRDDRDGYRWLGPDSLGVHDAVSLIVEELDGEVRARKVVRNSGSSQLLRAQVRDASFWRGPEVLSKRRTDLFRAPVAYYDGRRVPAWRLRFLVRSGDAMTVRFGAGGSVVRADVRSATLVAD